MAIEWPWNTNHQHFSTRNNLPTKNKAEVAPEESCKIHFPNPNQSHKFQGGKNSNGMKCE